jgi:hypothetical protein
MGSSVIATSSSHLFHHSRSLEHVRFGTVQPARPGHSPSSAEDDGWWSIYESAYRWLEERTGFWPLFLAVGRDRWALDMTGYGMNWRRLLSTSRDGSTYRKPGEFPNQVLFSFDALNPTGVFTELGWWTRVLNAHNGPVGRWVEKCLFKRSWNPARWLRAARRWEGAVQVVVPELDLRTASAIWCRNRNTRAELIRMGWRPDRVSVQRVSGRWWL